jgi:hypothetical protein
MQSVIKSFKYTKANGDASYRKVYPIGVQDTKLFAIDMTDLDEPTRQLFAEQLDVIHKRYIQEIEETVGTDRYRLFFFDGIS